MPDYIEEISSTVKGEFLVQEIYFLLKIPLYSQLTVLSLCRVHMLFGFGIKTNLYVRQYNCHYPTIVPLGNLIKMQGVILEDIDERSFSSRFVSMFACFSFLLATG